LSDFVHNTHEFNFSDMKTPNFPPCASLVPSRFIRRTGRRHRTLKSSLPLALFLPCLALTVSSASAQAIGYSADFEAPAYTPGSIHGQQGWSVDQGQAEILSKQGFEQSAGLVLRPVLPFSQARLSLEGNRAGAVISFLDLRILPIASETADKAELLDINSARIGLFREGRSNLAAVWVFDGDGKGGGGWLETSQRVEVDPESGVTRSWLRLTVREDIRRQTWDLWLDGAWLAAGLGFQEPRSPEAATCILMGDRKEPVALDNLRISPVNPLAADQDSDGLSDELEKQLGFDASRDDRDEDADGDGIPNLDQAVKSPAAAAHEPLTAARRVVALPEWSLMPGVYSAPVRLSLGSPTAGAALRYTLDGSDPRVAGPGVKEFSSALELSATTVVKAAAVSAEGRWSGVATGAWVFPNVVWQQQRPEGWPLGFEDTGRDQTILKLPVPYKMEFAPGSDPALAKQALESAFSRAPIVVLMADPEALMGNKEGLYSKASRSAGRHLEGVSVQITGQNGTETSTAGLSLSGNSSRFHDVTLKHSLRLKFEDGRPAGSLLPGKDNQVLLRHPTHDTWTVAGRWSGLRASARYFADGMADQWLAARGHPHLERRWVHVFLNQVYWGLYEAIEQQGPSSTGGTLLEGSPSAVTLPIYGSDAAWRKLLADALVLASRVRGGKEGTQAWQDVAERLDAPNLVDYIALNLWLGNKDWPSHNYLISQPDGRFRFLSWDAEWVMPVAELKTQPPLASVFQAADGPAALFSLLCQAPAFRQLIRERLAAGQGFNDEAFSRMVDTAAAGLRPLLPAEAARWGTASEPAADFMARWEGNVSWIRQQWVPGRAAMVRDQLEKHLQGIEANTAAAALRAASQGPATAVVSSVPVPFIAEIPDKPADRDEDGMSDTWELIHGFNPDDPADAAIDSDGDGLSNLQEYHRDRDPRVKDAPLSKAAALTTGAFNRMEKPVIRRGKIVDRAQVEQLRLATPGLLPVEVPGSK
jgi:CotH kinase protein/Chitobiase/beta-hexosaminidase C-terminal domain